MSVPNTPSASLFRVNATFRWFWTARAVSLIGDGVAAIALVLFVADRNGPTGVALVLLAESLPRFFGPLAGTLADRISIRRLLVTCELIQAVVWAAVALWRPTLALLIVLVILAAAAATVFSTAGRIVLPRTVEDESLGRANAWMGTAFNLQTVAGPLLGGLLTQLIHARGAFAVNVLSFIAGAVLLTRLPALDSARGGDRPGFLTDLREGLVYARASRFVRAVSVLLLFGIFFGSLDNVALVFFARRDLHAAAGAFGVLAGAFGIAMIAVSLWLTRTAERYSPSAVMLVGWALTGVGLALTGLAPWLVAAVVCQLVAGFGNGLANIGEETLLQRSVPDELLGRVGGLLSSAAFLGSICAYGIGGLLVTTLHPRTVFVVAGGGLFVVTLLCTRGVRSAARPDAREPDPLGVET
jgi:MFS family permease